MLETEKLDNLFSLLEKMTQSKISDPKFAPSPKMQRAEKYSICGFFFTALVFLGLAARQLFGGTTLPGFRYIVLAVFFILLFLAIVYMATFVTIALDRRRQHTSIMLTALKNDLHCDAKLITQLWTFDKATLAYGLVQYRHRWSSFEDRLAVLARKPGLFLVVAVLISLSAAVLLEEKDSYLLPWGLMIAAAILQVVVFHVLFSLERPKQVIKLLEYTIQHADQCNTSSPDANPPVQE